MRKTILSIILSAVLLFACFTSVAAEGSDQEILGGAGIEIIDENPINENEESSKEITNLSIPDTEVDPFSVLISGLDNYSDIYAGVYYEENENKYHVRAVDVEALKKIISSDDILLEAFTEVGDYIIFDNADFSMSELEGTQDEILDNFAESLETVSISIDEKANTLVVQANEAKTKSLRSRTRDIANRRSKSIKRRSLDNISLSDKIVYINRDVNIQETAGIQAGSGIAIGNVNSYSYAIGVVWNVGTTPTWGYLSCGHGTVAKNQSVSYNGATIGKVYRAEYEDDYDYSLITRTNTSYFPSSYAKNGTTKIGYTGTPVQGESVTVFGRNGNYSAQVKSLSVSWTVDGKEMKNRFTYSCIAANGDSGGAVVANRANGNKTFVGVQTNADAGGPLSYGCRWDKIKAHNTNMNASFGD